MSAVRRPRLVVDNTEARALEELNHRHQLAAARGDEAERLRILREMVDQQVRATRTKAEQPHDRG